MTSPISPISPISPSHPLSHQVAFLFFVSLQSCAFYLVTWQIAICHYGTLHHLIASPSCFFVFCFFAKLCVLSSSLANCHLPLRGFTLPHRLIASPISPSHQSHRLTISPISPSHQSHHQPFPLLIPSLFLPYSRTYHHLSSSFVFRNC